MQIASIDDVFLGVCFSFLHLLFTLLINYSVIFSVVLVFFVRFQILFHCMNCENRENVPVS